MRTNFRFSTLGAVVGLTALGAASIVTAHQPGRPGPTTAVVAGSRDTSATAAIDAQSRLEPTIAGPLPPDTATYASPNSPANLPPRGGAYTSQDSRQNVGGSTGSRRVDPQ